MNFNQKIIERMNRLHLTKAQLAKAADIPYTTLDSMLKRDSDQKRILSVFRIADLLGTSVEELVFSDEERQNFAPALTGAEEELLTRFRALDTRGQNAVRALLEHEHKQLQQANQRPPVAKKIPERLLKVYDLPAAAGVPLPLFSEDYTLQDATHAPERADFGIRLSGNSMEPLFGDGDTVWVRKQETLLEGEVGIFLLNGEALCKHLGYREQQCVLISENTRYEPIPVLEDDDLRVVGKVLY